MVGIFFMLSALFRSLQIALVTIVPNIIACLTILGTMGLLNIPLDLMTITIASITIGIAVDNCIHYVYRYKEYFNQTNNHLETIALCQNTVGKSNTKYFIYDNCRIFNTNIFKLLPNYLFWNIYCNGNVHSSIRKLDLAPHPFKIY